MVLTSSGQIYKMDPTKKFKSMLAVSLGDVSGITISPDGGNQVSLVV